VFDESTLVLEGVTLAEVVQLVVEVLVDLASGTVLDEETAKDTETAHPENLAIDIDISTLLKSSHRTPSPPFLRSDSSGWFLHTLAYERPRYPSSYRNHGVGQFVGRQSGHEHEHASAW
jgi:hypothetical protein